LGENRFVEQLRKECSCGCGKGTLRQRSGSAVQEHFLNETKASLCRWRSRLSSGDPDEKRVGFKADGSVAMSLRDDEGGSTTGKWVKKDPIGALRTVFGDELWREASDEVEPPVDRVPVSGGIRRKPLGSHRCELRVRANPWQAHLSCCMTFHRGLRWLRVTPGLSA